MQGEVQMNPLICNLTKQGARDPDSLYVGDLGHSDSCSLEIMALFSSLRSEDFCLGTNLLQFQEKCFCKGSFES